MEMEKRQAEKLFILLVEFQKNHKFQISNQIKDINQVFLAYYLAINTKKLMKKVDFKVGKLWLNLAWLYLDIPDDEMFDLAYHSAKENYIYVLMHTRIDIPKSDEQKLILLIGEMLLNENNKEEALKYYQKALMMDNKSMLAAKARDRIYELKNKNPE